MASYRRNLTALCSLGDPARIVFVEPISSLLHPGDAPDGSPEVLRGAMESGVAAARLGNPTDALLWGDRLREEFPDIGPPHARLPELGERLVATFEPNERDPAQRALDALPARATEAHWQILREVAAACGATVVATEPAFLADPRYLALDDPLFMDRVHPTLPGNVLLARVIADAIVAERVIAAGGPLPAGTVFDPRRITLAPPADEAARGWRLRLGPADH